MDENKPRDPLKYEPRFTFDVDRKAITMDAPTSERIAFDVLMAFNRDVDGKIRAALISLGWMPPEVAGNFKASFRANMILRAQPGEDIDAEIDRVFSELSSN